MITGNVTFFTDVKNVETEVMCVELDFELEWIG